MTYLFWTEVPGPGAIGVMPCPAGGEELAGAAFELRAEGVDVLVSCLEEDEAERFGVADEAGACAAAGIEFLEFPIADHDAPASVEETRAFAEGLARRIRKGKRVIIHCLAGIGRSPTIAAATLVTLGLGLNEALEKLSEARGFDVPEAEVQKEWLRGFADPGAP